MKTLTIAKFLRVQSNRRQKRLEKLINQELTYAMCVNRIAYLDRLYRVFDSIRNQTPIATKHPDGATKVGIKDQAIKDCASIYARDFALTILFRAGLIQKPI